MKIIFFLVLFGVLHADCKKLTFNFGDDEKYTTKSKESNQNYLENIQESETGYDACNDEIVEVIGNYSRDGMTWTAHYLLEDIYAWFDDLAKAYPDKASVIKGGSTYENRSIMGLKISFGTGKTGVFLEGGIHAREWLSPATVTYITNEIFTTTDLAFQKIARSFDWYIFPVVNPDGFVYSHSSPKNRCWRKTRTPYGRCFGADPNRNWDSHWMEYGASNDPCNFEVYGGPKPFSEVCTSTLSNFIRTIGPSLDAYLGFHSHAQALLLPYGFSKEHLDNYDDAFAIGKKAIEALSVRYGTKYRIGTPAEVLYFDSGVSRDWVKQEFGTPLVYNFEMRDKKSFVIPMDQIIPNCLEIMDALVALFEEAETYGYFELS